jgi:hypothetical protein
MHGMQPNFLGPWEIGHKNQQMFSSESIHPGLRGAHVKLGIPEMEAIEIQHDQDKGFNRIPHIWRYSSPDCRILLFLWKRIV